MLLLLILLLRLVLLGRRSRVCRAAKQAGISLRCVGPSCILAARALYSE